MALQWGHGEFAVENVVSVLSRLSKLELQWGHGEFAVENRIWPRGVGGAQSPLQWGHGEFAVENARRDAAPGAGG